MSYKSEFASNNADLQTILDVVNGLPDKVKKCKVYLNVVESSTSYTYATVYINGTEYVANLEETPEGTVVEVDPGTTIGLNASGSGISSNEMSYIEVDGEIVASGGQSYGHTVNKDTTVEFGVGTSGSYQYGYIHVTTLDTQTDTSTTSTFTPTDSGGTTYKSKFADNNVDLQKMLEAVNALEVYVEPETVTIRLVKSSSLDWDGGITYLVHNGTTYTSPTSFEAKVGDTIEITSGKGSNYGGFIGTFYETFASTGEPGDGATYTYTVVSSAIFEVGGDSSEGFVEITELTLIEYLQSDGTQYIETNFQAKINSRVVMDVEIQTPASATLGVFGSRGAASATNTKSFALWTTSSGAKVRSDYFGSSLTGSNSIVGTRVQIDWNGKNYTDTAGNSLTHPTKTYTGTDMLLFCVNNAGTAKYFSAMKLYSCQIYNGTSLVRDYWPCLDDDGVACLFDSVNNEYVYNAGTGSFTAGPTL